MRCYLLVLGLLSSWVAPPVGAAQSASQLEWEKVLQASKKEARVVVNGAPGEELLYQEFEKRHPGIKAVFIPGGNERVGRILSERRAGKYLVDVYIGGKEPLYSSMYKSGVLDPIRDTLMLPEVLDESKWRGRSHVYLDDERKYILSFNEVVGLYFHYNTKAVNPSQVNSYWDLLEPKWKGRMLLWEPLASGTDGVLRFLYYNPELGPKFLTRLLLDMQAVETRDTRQFVDWLASGRFAIAGLQTTDRSGLVRAKEQGLPVDWFDSRKFKEGTPLSPGAGNVALLNRAPHPHSAKVFINWLLSKEGQLAYQNIKRQTGGARNSSRIDISKDEVPSYAMPVEGVKYWNLTDREIADPAPVVALVKQLRGKH